MSALQPRPDAKALACKARAGAGLIALGVVHVWGAARQLVWLGVKHLFGVLLALIVLFEQWGWAPLAAVVASLSRLAPIAAVERFIARLPPYGALVVFAVPALLLIPVKLFAVVLIATGHPISAVLVFIAAKVVGTAIVARLYSLTEPQLMRIGWFNAALAIVAPKLRALADTIRMSRAWRYGRLFKAKARRALDPVLIRLKVPVQA